MDDFTTMRRIVKNLLRDLGFKNTKEAKDGQEALEMLEKNQFSLVITDTNMPKVTGLQLTKQIREHSDLKDIPILMVTPDAKREAIVTAAAAGITGFIVKPFTDEALLKKLDKMFVRLTKREDK